jgi:hypothetical protein
MIICRVYSDSRWLRNESTLVCWTPVNNFHVGGLNGYVHEQADEDANHQ